MFIKGNALKTLQYHEVNAPGCIGLDQVQVQPLTQRPEHLLVDLMKNSVLNTALVII
jgi:hypothetical protein